MAEHSYVPGTLTWINMLFPAHSRHVRTVLSPPFQREEKRGYRSMTSGTKSGPKLSQMVTAATKLKDSLEEKL